MKTQPYSFEVEGRDASALEEACSKWFVVPDEEADNDEKRDRQWRLVGLEGGSCQTKVWEGREDELFPGDLIRRTTLCQDGTCGDWYQVIPAGFRRNKLKSTLLDLEMFVDGLRTGPRFASS
jgi:hypothetical protein